MNTNDELPTSPDSMPWDYATTHPHWLRNALVTLDCHSVVDIHWETDRRWSTRTGEPEGEWTMMIETAGKQCTATHRDFEKALWYVTTRAMNSASKAWVKQEADREAALAKLTPEERKLLDV